MNAAVPAAHLAAASQSTISKPETLIAAAQRLGIDHATVRAQLAGAAKAKTKPKAKKPTAKAAKTSTPKAARKPAAKAAATTPKEHAA